MTNVGRGLIIIGIGVTIILMFALPFGRVDVPVGFLLAEVGGIILYAGLAILVYDIIKESPPAKKAGTSQSAPSLLCKNCGKDLGALPKDAKFCFYCGRSMVTVSGDETKIY